ncbi:MAG: Outer membrane protein class 4 precursor [Chlorobi bacterium OLB7]|nr:MAG: Outer membrane protein class 4 precursor [Chlorobi bacterium OLB7]
MFEVPLDRVFALGLRAGYESRGADLVKNYRNETEVKGPTGATIPADVEGTVVNSYGVLNATPYLYFGPVGFPLYFEVGPTILLPLNGSYNYTEKITDPANAQFRLNSQTARTLDDGEITGQQSVFGVTVATGINIPLSEQFKFFLEVQYSPVFDNITNNLRSGEEWKATNFSGTIGFRYAIGGDWYQVIPPSPPIARKPDTSKKGGTDPAAIPDTLFEAGAVTPEGLKDTVILSKRKIQSTEFHALLPYVFFERDSAVIPARYKQLDKKSVKNFEIERLPRGNTIGVYHQLLNIIGQRLRRNSRATITVTGCLSQFETDTTLARRRAEAVRDYIINTWRIRANRVELAVRGLPANPSLSEVDTAEGARENQRVEIYAKDLSLLAPVRLPDTATLGTAGLIRFLPTTGGEPDSTKELNAWSLDVTVGDSVITDAKSGYGTPPKQIDFEVERRPGLNLTDTVKISSKLTIRDSMDNVMEREQSKRVVIVQEEEYEEEREVIDGKYVDTYTLLLFGFDQQDIQDFSRQATAIMQDRITPQSVVRVIGHTDRIGLPPYNKALSQRRADAAAEALGIPVKETIGRGEKDLLYDNELPEGRYYCRTVTVIVETPVNPTASTTAKDRGIGVN